VYEYKIEKCGHNVGQVTFKHNKSPCEIINNPIPYGMWDKKFSFPVECKTIKIHPNFQNQLAVWKAMEDNYCH